MQDTIRIIVGCMGKFNGLNIYIIVVYSLVALSCVVCGIEDDNYFLVCLGILVEMVAFIYLYLLREF